MSSLEQRRLQRRHCTFLVRYESSQVKGLGFLKDLNAHGALLLCEPGHSLSNNLVLTPYSENGTPTGGRVAWSATDTMTERRTAGIEFHTTPDWVSHGSRPTKEKK